MVEHDTQIVNRLGLHARAAAKLVHLAGNFESSVTLTRNGEEVDAKSILGILLLAAAQGADVLVRCDGRDEEAALEAIVTLIDSGFDEDAVES
jgi:phosphocarrier protein